MKRKSFAAVLLSVLVALTLLACGEGDGYRVTFVSNGGTHYASVMTKSAEQSVILPTPERGGYTFAGWYDNVNCAGEAVTSPFTPTAATALYAKWVQNGFTVRFDTDCDTEYEDAHSNGIPIVLPVPLREHYVFDGWYYNAALSGEALGATYVPTGYSTLYAKLTAVDYHVVPCVSNGGTACAPANSLGDAVTLPVTTRYGYEFTGWFTASDCTGTPLNGTTYTPTGDVTLYAGWREVCYLYVYYEDTAQHDRISCDKGDEVTLADLDLPETVEYRGVDCAITHFEDVDGNPIHTVTVWEHTYVYARLDRTN
ncbi:MAG: InlB B-repeat-containing protein, partial [Clostridia bacterium]|nr:InlB B-repeat-containing protein [Clostridia bacterium]